MAFDYVRDPDEIVRRSFALVAAQAELGGFPVDIRPVAERLIHTSGMVDVVKDLVWSEGAGKIGRAALKSGAAILCDVSMVAAGLSRKHMEPAQPIEVAIAQPDASAVAARHGSTRCSAGFDCLADRLPGSVVVIGNAPTALFRVLELAEEHNVLPAIVLGFPVGFVGAVESKDALAANRAGIPFIALAGRRGGSAMAAAAVNALLRDRNTP